MSIESQKAVAESNVGKTFGLLKVIKRIGTTKYRRALYMCECACGEVIQRDSSSFTNKEANCGCLAREKQAKGRTIHGHSKRSGNTQVYRAWQAIKARCGNPTNKSYKYYGAKGITVCPEWDEFSTFYADMGDPPASNYEIDRIDPSQVYTPTNCRWISKQENVARVVHKRDALGKFTE